MSNETKLCRFCNEPLAVIIQTAIIPGKNDITLVTCNKPTCVIFAQTINLKRHYEGDLSDYLKKAVNK